MSGVNVEAEGYTVAYAITADNLRLGHSVVADCVNPWMLTRNEWRAIADRAGSPVCEIEIICSDISEHRRRVESRSADIAGHRLPTWPEVIECDYHPWERDRLIVDTAPLNVQESVQTILAALSLTDDAQT